MGKSKKNRKKLKKIDFFHMHHTLTSIQWVFSEHIGDVVTPSKRFCRHLYPPRENSKKQRKNHEFFEIKPPPKSLSQKKKNRKKKNEKNRFFSHASYFDINTMGVY